jgi:PAS domain S-box-containing protein
MGRARRNLPKVFSIGADFSTRLLQETPDGVMTISPDGKVPHWNRAAEIMFGFSCNEGLRDLLSDVIVPPGRVEEDQRIQNDALTSALPACESRRRRKESSLVNVSVSSKEPLAEIAAISNVTSRGVSHENPLC